MNRRHANPHDREVIDLMLAHTPKNTVEVAYNRENYMPRRRELAGEWSAMVMEGMPPATELIKLPRSGM